MFKKSAKQHNPLRPYRTAAEFLAISPGATCRKTQYSPDLSVYILRLADGAAFVVAGTEESAWDRGVEMLQKGCIKSQTQVFHRSVTPVCE